MNDGIDIELKDGENAYEVVGKYVSRYWQHNTYEDTVVVMEISNNDRIYTYIAQAVSPGYKDEPIWLNDWWEGEKYIRLFAIQGVSELDVTGGLYTE